MTRSLRVQAGGSDNVVRDDTVYLYDKLGRLQKVVAVQIAGTVYGEVHFAPGTNPSDAEVLITDTGTPLVTTYSYNLDGSLNRITLPNGAHTDYVGHDSMGRLMQMRQFDAVGEPITNYDYTYDAAGRLSHVGLRIIQDSVTMDQHSFYTYDALGRLTRSTVQGYGSERTVDFGYDLANNRLWESASHLDPYDYDVYYDFTQSVYNDRDQLVQSTVHQHVPEVPMWYEDAYGNQVFYDPSYAGPTTSYQYDANGSLLRQTEDFAGRPYVPATHKTTDYGYDLKTRMTAVVNPSVSGNQETLVYAYDIDGTRISQTSITRRLSDNLIVAGQSTRFNVDMLNPTGYSQVLQEFVSNYVLNDAGDPSQGGSWTQLDLYRSFLIGMQILGQSFANGYASAVQNVTGLTYNWLDAQGNLKMLLSPSGLRLTMGAFDYDAFGQLLPESDYYYGGMFGPRDLTITSLGFAGEYRDPNTGLIYLRDRWMNPATGRFTQMDRYRRGAGSDLLGWNLFGYANGDPVNRWDPSGWFTINEEQITQGIQSILFTMNLYGAYSNTRKALIHGISALNLYMDGDFWEGTVHLVAATIHTGMVALSLFGLRAGLMPPPTSGPGLALVSATNPEAVLVAMVQNAALRDWIIKQLVPAIGSLAVFMAGGGHSANWELRDIKGRIKTRGREQSGLDESMGRRLNWREQLETHTEKKILQELEEQAQPGDIITIRGTLAPCNPGNNGTGCWPAMEKFARDRHVTIYYKWEGGVETFPH